MKTIDQTASSLLSKFKMNSAPIPIKKLVKKLEIKLSKFDLGEDISGILVVENGKSKIGYSPYESDVRQRFTIAHELGHYMLHLEMNSDNLFVDNVKFRKQAFSQKEIIKERQANAFAAAILMPEPLVLKNYNKLLKKNEYITDEEIVKLLAMKFKVSQIAMTYRLINIGLIQQFEF